MAEALLSIVGTRPPQVAWAPAGAIAKREAIRAAAIADPSFAFLSVMFVGPFMPARGNRTYLFDLAWTTTCDVEQVLG